MTGQGVDSSVGAHVGGGSVRGTKGTRIQYRG